MPPKTSKPTDKAEPKWTKWEKGETTSLIAIWGEEDIKKQLEASSKGTYKKISDSLKEAGVSRDKDEVRNKIGSLKKVYYAVRSLLIWFVYFKFV